MALASKAGRLGSGAARGVGTAAKKTAGAIGTVSSPLKGYASEVVSARGGSEVLSLGRSAGGQLRAQLSYMGKMFGNAQGQAAAGITDTLQSQTQIQNQGVEYQTNSIVGAIRENTQYLETIRNSMRFQHEELIDQLKKGGEGGGLFGGDERGGFFAGGGRAKGILKGVGKAGLVGAAGVGGYMLGKLINEQILNRIFGEEGLGGAVYDFVHGDAMGMVKEGVGGLANSVEDLIFGATEAVAGAAEKVKKIETRGWGEDQSKLIGQLEELGVYDPAALGIGKDEITDWDAVKELSNYQLQYLAQHGDFSKETNEKFIQILKERQKNRKEAAKEYKGKGDEVVQGMAKASGKTGKATTGTGAETVGGATATGGGSFAAGVTEVPKVDDKTGSEAAAGGGGSAAGIASTAAEGVGKAGKAKAGSFGQVEGLLKQHIAASEGIALKKYVDSEGNPTIGIGHLIEPGENIPYKISTAQAKSLFEKDFREHYQKARSIPGFDDLDPVRKAALVDMTYNMGLGGVMSFKNTLSHIREGKFQTAAQGILSSRYASQVGPRAERIAGLIATGDPSYFNTGSPQIIKAEHGIVASKPTPTIIGDAGLEAAVPLTETRFDNFMRSAGIDTTNLEVGNDKIARGIDSMSSKLNSLLTSIRELIDNFDTGFVSDPFIDVFGKGGGY